MQNFNYRIIFLTVLLFLTLKVVNAQPQYFSKSIDVQNAETLIGSLVSEGNINLILSGSSEGLRVFEVNELGEVERKSTYATTLPSFRANKRSIVKSNGKIYFIGEANRKFYLFELNNDTVIIENLKLEQANQIGDVVYHKQHYYVKGTVSNSTSLLLKINLDGKVLWSREVRPAYTGGNYPLLNFHDDKLYELGTNNKEVIINTFSRSGDSLDRVKFNFTITTFRGFDLNNQSILYFSSSYVSNFSSILDFVKVNLKGDTLWTRKYDYSHPNYPNATYVNNITELKYYDDGSALFLWESGRYLNRLARLKPNGDTLWTQRLDTNETVFDGFFEFQNDLIFYGQIRAGDPVYLYRTDQWGQQNSIAENNQLENELSVFPNPSNGRFTFSFDGKNSNSRVSIYNQKGQLILEEEIHSNEYLLDLSREESGIYYYRIESSEGIYNGKLLLTK